MDPYGLEREGCVCVCVCVCVRVLLADGGLPDSLPRCLMCIPARLAHAARIDAYVRTFVHEQLAPAGLMPSTGPASTPEGAATVWVSVA